MSSLTESSEVVKDLLQEAVARMMENGAEYADALYDSWDSLAVQKDKVEERISAMPFLPAAGTRGMVLRAYKQGEWREASLFHLERDVVRETASKLPKFSPEVKDPVLLKELEPWTLDSELAVKRRPADVDLDEKLALVRRIQEAAMKRDNRIINASANYTDSTTERIFANSEGSMLRQVLTRTRVSISPVAKEGERMDYDYEIIGGSGGFELVEGVDEEKVNSVVDGALALLKAVQPPPGRLPIILDTGLAGTFAHESFGHGCEADQVVRNRSYLIKYLGKKIAPDNFNLCDDGTVPNGNGSLLFDDEGIRARKNYIVKNGVLQSFLYDRHSASALNAAPTGNGRRESFMRKEFVRMTNTYIEPADWKLEEMIENMDYGVMAVHWNSGMEDPLGGGMQLKSKKGFLIEKGEKTKLLSTLAISENVLDFLSSIQAIGRSDDFSIDTGFCGKGSEDYVHVGSGGPYVMSRAVVSGG